MLARSGATAPPNKLFARSATPQSGSVAISGGRATSSASCSTAHQSRQHVPARTRPARPARCFAASADTRPVTTRRALRARADQASPTTDRARPQSITFVQSGIVTLASATSVATTTFVRPAGAARKALDCSATLRRPCKGTTTHFGWRSRAAQSESISRTPGTKISMAPSSQLKRATSAAMAAR